MHHIKEKKENDQPLSQNLTSHSSKLKVILPREQPLQPLPRLLLDTLHLRTQPHLRHTLQMLRLHNLLTIFLAHLIQHRGNKLLSISGIILHGTINHLNSDALPLSLGTPAVVVRSHADHLISYFGFAGEFGLGETRHVDDGAVEGAVEVRFGASGELGAL